MPNFQSKTYWETRYASGNNSGPGSYGRLAEFKAIFLNEFVKKRHIKSVIEFGSGDGSQLKLSSYPRYLGLDVAETSIRHCLKEFKGDSSKSFLHYSPDLFNDEARLITAELSMSLEVIFHLVERPVYEKYLNDLFNASSRYVIIYASNKNSNEKAEHVRHRKFTDYIDHHFTEWKLIQYVKNPYPFDGTDPTNTSFSDFYVYRKRRTLR